MDDRQSHKILKCLYLMLCISLSGCAYHLPHAANAHPEDPYKPFNQVAFKFNDTVDRIILKPVATVYAKIVPKPLNKGIMNVFNNIDTVPIIINDILQLHVYQTASDIWRLAVNTTLGIGGLFDVATVIGLPRVPNDFGLTLARWGYINSNYLVIPFFGPTTVRDGIGIPLDIVAFSIYPYLDSAAASYSLYALGVVQRRAQFLRYQEVFDEAALDKYLFVRNAYLQQRQFQIEHQNGKVPPKEVNTLISPG